MSEIESKFVVVDGIRTHYLEAGSGPVLILIHGGGSGADAYGNWKSCLPTYARQFRGIAVDMVGFGKTDKPDPNGYAYTQKNRNEHIAGFVQAIASEPVSIMGNSMGGGTALGVAMMRPELVANLVLMGSAGIKVSDQPSPALKAIVEYDFTEEGMRRLVKALTGSRFKVDDEIIRYRHQLSIDPPTRAALIAINEETKRGGLIYAEDAVRAVKTRTLVVNGKEDQISTLARAWKFLELLDNSWGYIVPHCGHWVMIENSADFCAETTRFLLGDR
ncbi:MAG: alpha/beta hydrolase [Betaproteobacteria bacterium]|nr:alpha/beta hydrolase [Betaproteobacteria bacterium]